MLTDGVCAAAQAVRLGAGDEGPVWRRLAHHPPRVWHPQRDGQPPRAWHQVHLQGSRRCAQLWPPTGQCSVQYPGCRWPTEPAALAVRLTRRNCPCCISMSSCRHPLPHAAHCCSVLHAAEEQHNARLKQRTQAVYHAQHASAQTAASSGANTRRSRTTPQQARRMSRRLPAAAPAIWTQASGQRSGRLR